MDSIEELIDKIREVLEVLAEICNEFSNDIAGYGEEESVETIEQSAFSNWRLVKKLGQAYNYIPVFKRNLPYQRRSF